MEQFDKKLTTKEKALQLNLNSRIYGTVAEIGGGQEVAAYFFKAGAASGTIAKTMSAYDMTFSDAIYGKCARYVSKEKLLRMLDREYSLLDQRLTQRAKKSTFFAYANTVETINYDRSNSGHGWMGIRFQKHATTSPNECIIHVSLKDNDAEWQQQVLGMIGINLIHACYTYTTAEQIIESLPDNLRKDRFEIDMFSISGPDFHHVDNRLMTLKLVKNGLTKVAMFGANREVVLPSEVMYRKNVIILRGRFRPVTVVNVDMMLTGLRSLKKQLGANEDITSIAEITLRDLTLAGELDEQDYLDRVDLLCSMGQNVMISNYTEHYKLAGYLSQFIKDKTLAMIIGLNNLSQIFDESYYQNLSGGILESFARLFGSNVKLLIYPMLDQTAKKVKTGEDFKPEKHLQNLYNYFVENGKISSLNTTKTENLHIISDRILGMIQRNESNWENMVPRKVADAIKANHLFNYPFEVEMDTDDLV
ncbi:MAG: TonB-dependent receptor [Bacteroidota bacterium]